MDEKTTKLILIQPRVDFNTEIGMNTTTLNKHLKIHVTAGNSTHYVRTYPGHFERSQQKI